MRWPPRSVQPKPTTVPLVRAEPYGPARHPCLLSDRPEPVGVEVCPVCGQLWAAYLDSWDVPFWARIANMAAL